MRARLLAVIAVDQGTTAAASLAVRVRVAVVGGAAGVAEGGSGGGLGAVGN